MIIRQLKADMGIAPTKGPQSGSPWSLTPVKTKISSQLPYISGTIVDLVGKERNERLTSNVLRLRNPRRLDKSPNLRHHWLRGEPELELN